jgi:hypothetical protein
MILDLALSKRNAVPIAITAPQFKLLIAIATTAILRSPLMLATPLLTVSIQACKVITAIAKSYRPYRPLLPSTISQALTVLLSLRALPKRKACRSFDL